MQFNSKILLLAVILNSVILFLNIVFSETLYFGVADDYFMARLLEGALGDAYNVHLTFVNVAYAYVLLPFYRFFPYVGWYYVGEIFFVFISFTTITFILIKKLNVQWGVVVASLFLFLFSKDYYLTVHFTQCSAVLGAAGMALALDCFSRNDEFDSPPKKRILGVALFSIFLLLWSFAMRKDAFYMGLPFFSLGLFLCIKSRRKAKVLFIYLMILCLGLFTLDVCDRAHYTSLDYQKYMTFQNPRSTLGDNSNYDNEKVLEELEEQNFHAEDFSLLKNWLFYDTKVFSLPTMQLAASTINKYTPTYQLHEMLYKAVNWMDCSVCHPGLWMFFFISLLIHLSKKGSIPYPWLAFLIFLNLMSYLLHLHRFVYRVESGMWMYASVLAIPFIGKMPSVSVKRIRFVLAGALIVYLIYLILFGSYIRSPSKGNLWDARLRTKTAPRQFEALFKYIDSSPDSCIFLANTSTYISLSYYKERPYFSSKKGSWKKIIPLGYWTSYFPDIEHHLNQLGITNPMADITKENIFVINDDGLKDFLLRHYFDNVEIDTIWGKDLLRILKYTSTTSSASDR